MSKERLTEKTKDCFGYRLKDGSDAEVGFFKDYDAFYSHMMTVRVLGEYEDLEEILRDKLTEEAVNIITASKKDFSEWLDRILWTNKKCDEFAREVEKYRDLEEQGLLLRLPCKLGDDLYWIVSEDEDGNEKPTILKFENGIKHITITENGIWVNAEDEAPTELDVLGGKYALLTYEEAEEKLRELEEK